jgi:hypothetical protein
MYSHHSENGTNVADIPKRDVGDALLEVGDWKLLKSRFPSVHGFDSYPVHLCGKSPEGYGVFRGVSPMDPPPHLRDSEYQERMQNRQGTCVKCGERAPEEIMGLWTLHNWEVATR